MWSCVLQRGALARLDAAGSHELLDLPCVNPSDVTFGGPGLRTLFVTSIAVDLGGGVGESDGSLLRLDVGVAGRPEARYAA